MLVAYALAALALSSAPSKGDAQIDRLTGVAGARTADGVYRVELPRKELDVYAGEAHVPAAQGLTAWAAFQKTDKGALVVADLVLLEPQLDAAVSAALAGGFEIAGLDHHFSGETPRVVDLHLVGQGSEAALAGTVGKLFEVVRTKVAVESTPKLAELDTGKPAAPTPAKLEAVLGSGKVVDGVVRVEKARGAKLLGANVGASMGVGSWAAFSGADDQGAVEASFAAEEGEIQGLIQTLRANGLTVTGIDAPWPGLQPAYRSVHAWGTGPVEKLARGVKAGLGKLK